MKNSPRIYIVRNGKDEPALVRATNQALAIRHVVRGKYTAKPATQDELYDLARKGVEVQDAHAADAGE